MICDTCIHKCVCRFINPCGMFHTETHCKDYISKQDISLGLTKSAYKTMKNETGEVN